MLIAPFFNSAPRKLRATKEQAYLSAKLTKYQKKRNFLRKKYSTGTPLTFLVKTSWCSVGRMFKYYMTLSEEGGVGKSFKCHAKGWI